MNPQERKKLENKIHKKLDKYIKINDSIIAGISGGPDSVFLLEVLKKFKEKTPIKIIIAHLNHQLRGKEANQDEKFVKKISKDLIFENKKVNIKILAQKNKTGLEETGRNQRYNFFNQLLRKHKASLILTAHHADDNIETILLNIIRGCSLQGLCGMQEKENNLLRPLLSVTKNQITNYLKKEKIPFKEESTNKDTKYKRNFIRHEIIPEIKKINPSLAETLAKNAENFREINEYFNQKAENWIKKNSLNKNFSSFPLKKFQTLKIPIQKQILRNLHQKHTGSTQNLESKHLEEVTKIISANIGNKQKTMGKLKIEIKFHKINVFNKT